MENNLNGAIILIAKPSRDLAGRVTTGKEYVAVNGIEGGFFPDRPYVTIMDDNGESLSCHSYRFDVKE